MSHKYLSYAKDYEFFSFGLHASRDVIRRKNPAKRKSDDYCYHFGSADVLELLKILGYSIEVEDQGGDFGDVALIIVHSHYNEKTKKETVDLPDDILLSPALWAFNSLFEKQPEKINIDALKAIEETMLQAAFKDLDEKPTKSLDEVQLALPKMLKVLQKELSLLKEKSSLFNFEEEKEINSNLDTSFYIEDINEAVETPLLSLFLNATSPTYKRSGAINIDSDANELKGVYCKSKESKWPSIYYPSLMQQIAVNLATGTNETLIAVNGPPGTGKTTLLKEIIAANIVMRASELSKLKNANDAFKKPKDGGNYWEVIDEIKQYGMLVCSSNNSAVENISKELPQLSKLGKCLCPDLLNEVDYFKETAASIINNKSIQEDSDTECWGLISIALGKKENINNTLSYLKGSSSNDKEYKTLEYYLTQTDTNFYNAKTEFIEAKKEFFSYCKGRSLPMERGFFENASSTTRVIELKGKKPRDLKDSEKTEIENWERSQFGIDSERKDEDNKTRNMLKEKIFWKALALHMAFACSSSCLQENLNSFYEALSNQKKRDPKSYASLLNTFFLVVPVISSTFASLHNMLKGIGKEEIGYLIIDEAGQALPHYAIGALYRSKRAIVVGDPFQIEPIVRLPKPLDKFLRERHKLEELSDEMPIESIQTVADRASLYHGMRRYKAGEPDIAIGCPLVVHRRCEDPMFSISNNLAYQGLMINKTEAKPDYRPLAIKKSCWFDIKGNEESGQANRAVEEQNKKVLELLNGCMKEFIEENRIFIISPFTSVISSLKKSIAQSQSAKKLNYDPEELRFILSSKVGTIHTFQGREADEVIIVLGCDAKSRASANWVGQKPNIMNVAVSRAKHRVAIIGDSDLWAGVNNVTNIISRFEDLGSLVKSLKPTLSFINENKDWVNLDVLVSGKTARIGWGLKVQALSKKSKEELTEINENLIDVVISMLKGLTLDQIMNKYSREKPHQQPIQTKAQSAELPTNNNQWKFNDVIFELLWINQKSGYLNLQCTFKAKTVKFGISAKSYRLSNEDYYKLKEIDPALPNIAREAVKKKFESKE